MIGGLNLIDGAWRQGAGAVFESLDPARETALWQGPAADAGDVDAAVTAARRAQPLWAEWPLERRCEVLERYAELVQEHKDHLAEAIARETGKPLWDALGEAGAVAAKVAISIKAYHERTGDFKADKNGVRQRLVHRPHGVMAVFGPFNFPAHLPNGHIVPALLAGNAVVFKPSEITPWTAQRMAALWERAGLPRGVLNLVHGARETGIALSSHEDVDGILFTGSVSTGKALHKQTAGAPGKILALEMGGNNPLIVDAVEDKEAAALLTIQSAFVTSGQRCTCARRLIVPEGAEGDVFIDTLTTVMDTILVGAWDESPEPFMGPLVSAAAVEGVLDKTASLLENGAQALRPPVRLERGDAFLTPGLIDVTGVHDRPDEEIFGPVLHLIRVGDFDAALTEANATRYGLSSGLLSDDPQHYKRFHARAQAGIVNWNRPTTGAASNAPFGGIKDSGNHRPSAYYAADYCAFPVASLEDVENRVRVETPPKGVLIGEVPAK